MPRKGSLRDEKEADGEVRRRSISKLSEGNIILLPFTEYCRQILFSKDIDLYIAL